MGQALNENSAVSTLLEPIFAGSTRIYSDEIGANGIESVARVRPTGRVSRPCPSLGVGRAPVSIPGVESALYAVPVGTVVSTRILLFAVAALLATAVYYLLVSATDAPLVVVLVAVVVVGIAVPQAVVYWRNGAAQNGA